jgi:hypothetical protein
VTSDCTLPENFYTQEISLILLNPPASGTITLNGQDFILEDANTSGFALGVLDADLTLEFLVSDGLPVDLDVSFSDDASCEASFPELFIAPFACHCINDANADGIINVGDILMVLAEFGCISGCTADVTNDGNVNVSDLLSILSEFGQACNL